MIEQDDAVATSGVDDADPSRRTGLRDDDKEVTFPTTIDVGEERSVPRVLPREAANSFEGEPEMTRRPGELRHAVAASRRIAEFIGELCDRHLDLLELAQLKQGGQPAGKRWVAGLGRRGDSDQDRDEQPAG